MLHMVNKSPFASNALQSCLRLAAEGSAILLIEDAVYGAASGTEIAGEIGKRMKDFSFYALGPDLAARGIEKTPLIKGVKIVDYEGFVDLVTEHDASHSWL